MISKVKDYLDLYEELEIIDKRVLEAEESIRECEDQRNQYQEEQEKVNYKDPKVVVDYIEIYIKESIAREKEKIRKKVKEQLEQITHIGDQYEKKFHKAFGWLSEKKFVEHIESFDHDLTYEQYEAVERVEKVREFTIATLCYSILSIVFRFDCLRFLPKVLRVIMSVIFWGIVVISRNVTRVYNQFGILYEEEIAVLDAAVTYDHELEMMGVSLIKEFIGSCIISVLIPTIIIIAINIIVYRIANYYVKKFLEVNSVICLSMIDGEGLVEKMCNESFEIFRKETLEVWEEERDFIKKNGLSDHPKEGSLVALVKEDLYEQYHRLEEKIEECNVRIEELVSQGEQDKSTLEAKVEELKEKREKVESFVNDATYNQAVLSPYVPVISDMFDEEKIRGVGELLNIKHNCKAVLMQHKKNDRTDDEFRKLVAEFIECLMQGFMRENSRHYIKMYLVDSVGLYFPESRTGGFMEVVREQQRVQELFDELKEARKEVNSLGNGMIGSINPKKLENGENPIPYRIVFIVGYDCKKIEQERTQLFIAGEHFGFLPIIFMEEAEVDSLLESEGSGGAFSTVVKNMKNNDLIISY